MKTKATKTKARNSSRHQGIPTAPTFAGDELVRELRKSAEREVAAKHVAVWGEAGWGISSWAAWARANSGMGQAASRAFRYRYAKKRNAFMRELTSLIANTRRDLELWYNLSEEFPELRALGRLQFPIQEMQAFNQADALKVAIVSLSSLMGPTWKDRWPKPRELALLVILSGWRADTWKVRPVTVAKAIDNVSTAVRLHLKRHPY